MLSYKKISFSNSGVRIIKLAAFAVFSLILSACTIAPVYSDARQDDNNFNLQFESANSRLEQIVYSKLAASFSPSPTKPANLVKIAVSSSNVTPGVGSVGLMGQISVTDIETAQIIFFGSRTASATYTTSGQFLANQQAANEATERAANELAEIIRLTLIGILSAQPQT